MLKEYSGFRKIRAFVKEDFKYYYSIFAFQICLILIRNFDRINKVKSDFENKIILIEISEGYCDKNRCCRR